VATVRRSRRSKTSPIGDRAATWYASGADGSKGHRNLDRTPCPLQICSIGWHLFTRHRTLRYGRRRRRRAPPLDRSPAPFVHAATRKIRKELGQAYGWFLAAYREAADRLRNGDRNAAFPPGSFPPHLPFVPA
jgi:hypothetical protein